MDFYVGAMLSSWRECFLLSSIGLGLIRKKRRRKKWGEIFFHPNLAHKSTSISIFIFGKLIHLVHHSNPLYRSRIFLGTYTSPISTYILLNSTLFLYYPCAKLFVTIAIFLVSRSSRISPFPLTRQIWEGSTEEISSLALSKGEKKKSVSNSK